MGGIFFLCGEGLWEFLFVSQVVIDPRVVLVRRVDVDKYVLVVEI
jgi:hypothetical protein